MEERAYKTVLENFKQAAKEVFLPKESKRNGTNNKEHDMDSQMRSNVVGLNSEKIKKDDEREKTIELKLISDEAEAKPEKQKYAFTKKVSTPEPVKEVDTGLISESTKIEGDITTDSNLVFAGEIKGNIESKNNIIVSGKVYGNINCKDVEINEAVIEGNITVQESVKILEGSIIVGDVSANTAVVNGNIAGNVKIKNDIKIYKNAYIIGDITASTMYVEDGAVIKGVVNILAMNKEENEEQ
ncbi:MAG: polymer-forming cytoskeletal protein [Alcaligenaceae bacterium]|nr:polymer-forming cytoskeletal protein [Alcaligenaceae bacterium]